MASPGRVPLRRGHASASSEASFASPGEASASRGRASASAGKAAAFSEASLASQGEEGASRGEEGAWRGERAFGVPCEIGFRKALSRLRWTVRRYPPLVDVTLSIKDETLSRARSLAHRRGRSLSQIVQDCLEEMVAKDAAQAVAELERLWEEKRGDSSGGSWKREDVYDRAVFSAE